MTFFESAKAKQLVTLTSIILLAVFLFFSLIDFLPSFLGALALFVVLSPLMNYLFEKKAFNKTLSAAISIVISALVIFVPMYIFSNLLIKKINFLLSGNTEFFSQLKLADTYLKEHLNINVLSAENIITLQNKISEILPQMLNQTFTVLFHVILMYFILFYMLYYWHNITETIVKYFPYKQERAELFSKALISQTYSNVVGAPLLALIQGVFSVVGFSVFGLHEALFWGIMCGFLSFVPFVGTALVWIPAGIVQLSMGEDWQGIGILIYGAVVITNIDNVFRFILQKKLADIHPLITIFGVIIGVRQFGLPGLIFGPLLISYLILMIDVYRKEYGNKSFSD